MQEKSHSVSSASRFPRVRGSRTPSVTSMGKPPSHPMLVKQDMMIKEFVEDEYQERDAPPAAHGKSKILVFRPIVSAERPPVPPNRRYFFKFLGSEVKLIRWVLEDNGFRESKKDWLIGWSNIGLRSNVYQCLTKYQKVNHFPRTVEITKKDNLFKNITRMQTLHGKKHYDFIPQTYVLPQELSELSTEMERDNSWWIVKPTGSSQGRGIFLTSRLSEIPTGQPMVASRYIPNPLLINGLKFDLRVYVAITSVDPLRVYMYKEGLVRFATEPYDISNPSNRFMHLTNYSLNKYSPMFQDLDQDGKGYKWTHTALKEFLASQNIDSEGVWEAISDIVVKTLISIESTINASMKMFVPHSRNCFELLGFDILIDDTLRPWLIEVNLSPSMNTDTNIDLKVKAPLVADLLNLIGVPSKQLTGKKGHRNSQQQRPAWNSSNSSTLNCEISKTEIRVINEAKAEMNRCGNFECVFPSAQALNYKRYFETERPFNNLLIANFSNALKKEIYKNQLSFYDSKLENMKKEKRIKKSQYNFVPNDMIRVRTINYQHPLLANQK